MNTINISADATASRIGIGNQYENLATAVVFDCSKFAEDHGAGTAQVVHRRPTESIGYVCTNVSQEGNTVTWLVTDDDTSFTGKGLVQLRWYVDDVLRESVIFPTYILPSVTSSDDAPAEVKSALEQLMEYINDNTISIEDLDERIANYFYDHPLPMEGEADGLVAGSAKQLLSDSYTLDQVPYLYRKSPDSDRAVEEIVGGTVWWNQLVPTRAESGSYIGVTISETKTDGSITVTGQLTAASRYIYLSVPMQTNHKYLVAANKKVVNKGRLFILGNYSLISDFTDNSKSALIYNNTSYEYVRFSTGGTLDEEYDQSYIPQVTDLTTMFGTTIADYIYSLEQATAGAGVAKLKEWGFFTEDYYEYCEPTLRSVEGLVSKKTVGFNQWDEEWEVGSLTQDGNDYASTTRIRSKGFNPILEETDYYCLSATTCDIHFYDGNHGHISSIQKSNGTFTTPNGAKFFRFCEAVAYGTTYNHDICINLSDPAKNGTYEPYEKHSYPLDSSLTLRGVPKLITDHLEFDGDKYYADGQVERRYGIVVLDGTQNNFGVSAVNDFAQVSWNGYNNIGVSKAVFVSDKFVYADSASGAEGRIYPSNSASRMFLGLPSTVTTAAQAQAWFASNPTTVIYPLATPTTETAQPYHNPQIVGDTEEFVTTGLVPVGHSTRYYQNLRKKIENLPWNFATLIAPTEVTNKATRNYTTGSYLILNNVLYKVTSNIANGGTITPNTNCTATTIMAEFMSL